MSKFQTIKAYLHSVRTEGKITFTLDELDDVLPIKRSSISRSLNRLTRKREIVPIKNGFYVILPPHEQKRGITDPRRFIDQLMVSIGKKYYVGLLTAAAWHGAAHHAPMTFYVITEYPAIKDVKKRGIHVHFVFTSNFPDRGIIQTKTDTGYVKTASSALTLLDLVKFERSIGHLDRVLEVISELVDSVKEEELRVLLPLFSNRLLQRLGYLLEFIIEEKRLHPIIQIYLAGYSPLRYIPLISGHQPETIERNRKWKIDVNEVLELDL